ncbi:MAG TPA: hypothetical protein VHO06_03870 [Polyangia bacterium]|nr:hypothetical protein [Polyangia bacterium]
MEPKGKAALVTARSIWASSREDFAAFLRVASYSVADPASFAVPVDADEDGESYTVVFELGGHGPTEVDVQATERTCVIWGATWRKRREMRLCVLPEPIDPKSLELTPTADALALYVRKARGDRRPQTAR